MASLDGELIDDPAQLAALAPEWHELALANARPMALPAWLLAWHRHMAPPRTALRAVAVRDRGTLLGLAPMFVDLAAGGRVDYRLMGAPLPRQSPLAVPGREWEVAEVMAGLLAEADPRPDIIALESHSLGAQWAAALQRGWPAPLMPISARYLIQDSPVVSLAADSYEAWLAGKSSNYRSEMRRRRRRFEQAGGTVRISTGATVRQDVETLIALHRGRWEGRGSSSIVQFEQQTQAVLGEVGEAHADDGIFRLVLLELEGKAIAAQLHMGLGGEVLFWNGGWDEDYASFNPSVLCLLAALEDAFARGDRRLDLGPGAQPYKLRMAEGNDPLAWTVLMVPGARLPLTLARTMPMVAKRRSLTLAKHALPAERVDRLRELRTRWRPR